MKIVTDGIVLIVEDADHYLQINDICEADLIRIWERLRVDYDSYDKWFCYHNTEIPQKLLNDLGAVLEDDSIEMRLAPDGFLCIDVFGVTQVTEADLDAFAAFHDMRNPDMYWTSERIRRRRSDWEIFVIRSNEQISGYALTSMWDAEQAEIFCIEAMDHYPCDTLFVAAAKCAFDHGKNEVLYMADEHSIYHHAALRAGFAVTGFYKGYRIKRGG